MPVSTTNYARNGGSIGYIKTDSPYVMLSYRDFGEIDGDRVRLIVNGRVVIDEILLTDSYGQFRVNLESGTNTIEFYAVNAGTVGPNTAQLNVTDSKGFTIGGGGWSLDAGALAKLTVMKY
jgi:hypothetical protein